MSFIKIIEEKNPIEMHNKVYEASKNNALTPKFCMEILSHTNVSVIKGEMLEEIGKLPIEEQKQYKKAILSMFDGRQTSEKVKNKALELAKNNGFESELNDVIERTGGLGYPARGGCDKIYVIEKAGDYSNVDFSSYEGVIVKGNIEEKICILFNDTQRGIIDLRGAKDIDLRGCDLSKVTKIIFEEGASVFLGEAKNLHSNLDISMCDSVNFYRCDLEGINLKFKEGARVNFCEATNLPSNLDVSMCDEVSLWEEDVSGMNLKLKEGSTIRLYRVKNLPKDLNVSMYNEVDLNGNDLSEINLRFREGAKVYLEEVKKLPTNLDVSMCREIKMMGANISNVKELKFKNKEQMNESLVEIPKGWKGKIIYTDYVSFIDKVRGLFSDSR